ESGPGRVEVIHIRLARKLLVDLYELSQQRIVALSAVRLVGVAAAVAVEPEADVERHGLAELPSVVDKRRVRPLEGFVLARRLEDLHRAGGTVHEVVLDVGNVRSASAATYPPVRVVHRL